MKLPFRKNVIISRIKITDYLFSEIHPVGQFKAKFFRNAGFNKTNVEVFIKTLHTVALNQEVIEKITSEYGTKYLIEGKIKTPTGKNVTICTVWILESNHKRPRFITAYPI